MDFITGIFMCGFGSLVAEFFAILNAILLPYLGIELKVPDTGCGCGS